MKTTWYKFGFWIILVLFVFYIAGSMNTRGNLQAQLAQPVAFAEDTGTTTVYKTMSREDAIKYLIQTNSELVKANRELNALCK